MRSKTNEKRNIIKVTRDFKFKQCFQTKSRKGNHENFDRRLGKRNTFHNFMRIGPCIILIFE